LNGKPSLMRIKLLGHSICCFSRQHTVTVTNEQKIDRPPDVLTLKRTISRKLKGRRDVATEASIALASRVVSKRQVPNVQSYKWRKEGTRTGM
jgi:hypothetical protein